MKKKENLLLNSFCFNNKLEKKWHKRLDVNNDDIIFKKYMNGIILAVSNTLNEGLNSFLK